MIVQFIDGIPNYYSGEEAIALSNNRMDDPAIPNYQSAIEAARTYGLDPCFLSSPTAIFPVQNIPISGYQFIQPSPGWDSLSRLSKARMLISCINDAKNHGQLLYNAKTILDNLTIPYNSKWGTQTIWTSIKDLSKKEIYYEDIIMPRSLIDYDKTPKFYPDIIKREYKRFSLKAMNLDVYRSGTALKQFDQSIAATIDIIRPACQ